MVNSRAEKLALDFVQHNRTTPYDSLNAMDRYMKNAFVAGYVAAQRWIDINQELPEQGTYCIAVEKMLYTGTGEGLAGFVDIVTVDETIQNKSHWLPLPELPVKPKEGK